MKHVDIRLMEDLKERESKENEKINLHKRRERVKKKKKGRNLIFLP